MSTSKVIEWLSYYGVGAIRINEDDIVEVLELSLDSFKIKIRDVIYTDNEILSFWYRRGELNLKKNYTNISGDVGLNTMLNNHERYESNSVVEFLYFLLERKKVRIGSRYNANVNKLCVLNIARDCGLQIPPTFVVTSKDATSCIVKNFKKAITKPIAIPFSHFDQNNKELYTTYTEELLPDDLPENFAPSLVQKCIEKRYEIRVFFLKGSFYSMAIFSQGDNQTKTDFRKYNLQHPNRFVPYSLPTSIEKSLGELMQKLNLDTGSIDLIKGTDNNYYFLEVNPVGQFGMVSYPCYYQLEKKIAEILLLENNHKQNAKL